MVSSTVLRRLVLAVVIFLLPALVHAQEATISGTQSPTSSGAVLPGVDDHRPARGHREHLRRGDRP